MMTQVKTTEKGTLYLTEPHVEVLAESQLHILPMTDFLDGFAPSLGFDAYLHDVWDAHPAEELIKVAGQTCYMAFGDKRTRNAEMEKYIRHILESGHGSVLEHYTATLLLWGIDRSVTHELVRHRAGFAYSQVSQRYVSGATLRFVERPEWQKDEQMHRWFTGRIDAAAAAYAELTDALLARQKEASDPLLSGDARTELRKKVQQAARACLPNETEAPIIVTGNGRSWRHFLEMRANSGAEILIRGLAMNVYRSLKRLAPILFGDYEVITLRDGTHALSTPFKKV